MDNKNDIIYASIPAEDFALPIIRHSSCSWCGGRGEGEVHWGYLEVCDVCNGTGESK